MLHVCWMGRAGGWAVKDGGRVLARWFKTRADAEAWLAEREGGR